MWPTVLTGLCVFGALNTENAFNASMLWASAVMWAINALVYRERD